MEAPPENSPGIVPSLTRLLQILLSTARNRLELAAVEAREEEGRWVESFLLVAALVALGSLTLALTTLTIVMLCWEEHRAAALVGLSVFYLLATLAAGLRLRWRLRNWSAFSATVSELQKDKEWLDEQIPKSSVSESRV